MNPEDDLSLRFVRDGLTLGWDLLTVKDLSELKNTMVIVAFLLMRTCSMGFG